MAVSRLGRASGLLLASALALIAADGCSESAADILAEPELGGVTPVDAGLDCSLAAQLQRHALPVGISNILLPECEWPITSADSIDGLRFLINIGVGTDTKANLCALDPFHVWQEPPAPLPAQRLVFCPQSCSWLRSWLECQLRNDPCRSEDDDADDDAGLSAYCPP
ncbi:MAG TPA: hypothetical protein VHZ95_18150 [Polyangiales bacterium]|jgi:hypothetical protein|nr:hypothetical protein [Polyangiales bacterium]